MDKKIIRISGSIDEKAFGDFTEEFDVLVGEDITVIISSCGGDVDVGVAIYESLRTYPGKVTTHAVGMVCSIATLIFAAGDERTATVGTTFMIHDGSTGFDGPLATVRTEINEVERQHEFYLNALVERAKISLSYLRDISSKQTFYSAYQALGWGLVDTIIPYRKESLNVPF